jgi:glucose/arabinose dehydrogenase
VLSRPFHTVIGIALAALLLAVSACGAQEDDGSGNGGTTAEASPSATESESGTPASSESASPEAEQAKSVKITFSAGDVDPVGKVVKLKVGEKLVLDIQADEAGELHVHSSPEQEIGYPAGASKSEIVIDRPGVVEVESHDLHKLILQLEVR